MAVIDVCTFNGEQDMWDIHYNILKDYVDEFIVLEFDKTFTGRPKKRRFSHIPYEKVTYHFVTEDVYGKYMDLALSSPNTQGAEHWKREFCQKESIKDYLTHLRDDDIVFIGDVDEIWNPILLKNTHNSVIKLGLNVYSYFLNNHSDEQFWGTVVARYGLLKNKCLNHVRSKEHIRTGIYGWHFTNMGGLEEVRRKLNDSYTEESYNTPDVQAKLESRFGNRDYIGRDFKYTVDESNLPKWLLENKEKYTHLWK